jgi:6,7-dimethyl-8-ribityllumazine synthase
MPNEHRARLNASGRRVAIVASRFNEHVTRRLVDGAVDCLVAHGASQGDIDVYWVNGSFELPQTASRLARAKEFDGIIAAGCLIRGETLHFEVLARSVGSALESIAVDSGVPLTFGVLTVDTTDQAVERAGGKHGNAGWNAALSLVELLGLWDPRDG